jgi:DNA-binding transcriptional regulator YdaS (Cro superfamily)
MDIIPPKAVTPGEALRLAVKESGGLTAVASKLGVTIQRLGNWADRDAVPVEFCNQLVIATGGRLQLWDLRPDDWHRIWPYLIGTAGAPQVEGEGMAQ